MSVVYLAINERANRYWAIKEVRTDGVVEYDIIRKSLTAEMEILKKLRHPRLPQIADVIDGRDSIIIVMDYIEGRTLEEVLCADGLQDAHSVIFWGIQICDVLEYLHTRRPPIIYRDLKPSNLMLRPDGQIMLIDFGAAAQFHQNGISNLSGAGIVRFGTPGYAAPEQFGGKADVRTDIYNFGITLYRLLTGEAPGAFFSFPPSPAGECAAVLKGLGSIIEKCTRRNPYERYQSCREVAIALKKCAVRDAGMRLVAKKRLRMFFLSAGACVLCLACAIIFNVIGDFVINGEYEALLTAAGLEGVSPQDREGTFITAIEMMPGRVEAYDGLLELYHDCDVYGTGDETLLSRDEKARMDSILTKYSMELKKNSPQGYYRFFYDMGREVFFNYNALGTADRAQARRYFEEAAEAGGMLGESKIRLSEHLAYIAANIDVAGGEFDRARPDEGGYGGYFSGVLSILDENLIDAYGDADAVAIYRFLVNDIYERVHTEGAKEGGLAGTVGIGEVAAVLEGIREAVDEYAEGDGMPENSHRGMLSDDIENIRQTVSLALYELGILDE